MDSSHAKKLDAKASASSGITSAPTSPPISPLVEVRHLSVTFTNEDKTLHAVRDVSFTLHQGKTLCLVGESGCGKSMTALALMGLLPEQGKMTGETLTFEGHDMLNIGKKSKELRALRGRHMAMIFQDPMTSLNPVYRVGEQVAEALRLHLGMSKAEARTRTIELFRQVGIPSPDLRVDDYPHQLSGGMRQRVMIAMALSCGPRLLIADEPTTALDVTVQKQILQLLAKLRSSGDTCDNREAPSMGTCGRDKGLASNADSHSAQNLGQTGAAILFITHDLGVVAQTADEVAVMYAGRIVEHAPVEALFAEPKHPYTQGLMSSAPTLELGENLGTQDQPTQEDKQQVKQGVKQGGKQGVKQGAKQRARLTAIKGNVPPLDALPSGCAFHDRCPRAMERCACEEPPRVEIPVSVNNAMGSPHQTHIVRCWLYADNSCHREVARM